MSLVSSKLLRTCIFAGGLLVVAVAVLGLYAYAPWEILNQGDMKKVSLSVPVNSKPSSAVSAHPSRLSSPRLFSAMAKMSALQKCAVVGVVVIFVASLIAFAIIYFAKPPSAVAEEEAAVVESPTVTSSPLRFLWLIIPIAVLVIIGVAAVHFKDAIFTVWFFFKLIVFGPASVGDMRIPVHPVRPEDYEDITPWTEYTPITNFLDCISAHAVNLWEKDPSSLSLSAESSDCRTVTAALFGCPATHTVTCKIDRSKNLLENMARVFFEDPTAKYCFLLDGNTVDTDAVGDRALVFFSLTPEDLSAVPPKNRDIFNTNVCPFLSAVSKYLVERYQDKDLD